MKNWGNICQTQRQNVRKTHWSSKKTYLEALQSIYLGNLLPIELDMSHTCSNCLKQKHTQHEHYQKINNFFKSYVLSWASKICCPVASSAHGVEGEVGGALVDPPHDALVERTSGAGDELLARLRMREDPNILTLRNAIGQDSDLELFIYCLNSFQLINWPKMTSQFYGKQE